MIYRTHYEVLGVARNASLEAIRTAYESLSQLWDPHRNRHRQAEAEYRLTGVKIAYEVLSDPEKRAAYDAKLDAELKPTQQPQQQEEPEPLVSPSPPAGGYRIPVELNSPAISHDQTLLESIGIETLGGTFTLILAQGQSVPCVASQRFSTAEDYQKQLSIHLLRGNGASIDQNCSLGKFVVEGIRPLPRGVPKLMVSFGADGKNIYLEVADEDEKSDLFIWRQRDVEIKTALCPSKPPTPLPDRSAWEDDFGLRGISNSPVHPYRSKPEKQQPPQPQPQLKREAAVAVTEKPQPEKEASKSFTATKWILCISIIAAVGPGAGFMPAVMLAAVAGAVINLFKTPFDGLPAWLRIILMMLSVLVLGIASMIGHGATEGRIRLGPSMSHQAADLTYRQAATFQWREQVLTMPRAR